MIFFSERNEGVHWCTFFHLINMTEMYFSDKGLVNKKKAIKHLTSKASLGMLMLRNEGEEPSEFTRIIKKTFS